MPLIREAKGLPKFTMTCSFWQSPQLAGISLAALGLHTAVVSFSYRHETDGLLPGDTRRLAAALGLLVDEVDPAAAELLELGAWRRAGDDLEIVDFTDDHPSSVELVRRRERNRLRALKANHARWHKTEPDPECSFCASLPGSSEGDLEGSSDESCDGSPLHNTALHDTTQHEEREGDEPDPELKAIVDKFGLSLSWVVEAVALLDPAIDRCRFFEKFHGQYPPGDRGRNLGRLKEWAETEEFRPAAIGAPPLAMTPPPVRCARCFDLDGRWLDESNAVHECDHVDMADAF